MKVGILTYHDTTNYGAVLQAYALQKIINSFNIDCEIIDYKCDAITDRYKITPFYKCKNIKKSIKALLTNKSNRILKEKFKYFNEKYQRVSPKTYYLKNIHETNKIYDKFIVGSDQVWNLDLCGKDTTYMLDFVNNNYKKNSYAASFGYQKVPDDYKHVTIELLKKFNNIFVREEQGIKIVKELLNKNVQKTLDPTLLMNSIEWDKLICNTQYNIKNYKKNYILLYIIAPNKEIINFAKKIARKEKCEIIYLNHSYKNILGVKNVKGTAPEEFIEYIKNARYVITTSFHGVAFSINYKKQFFYALSSEKDNFNSRIENLVDILNLKNREIGNNFEAYSDINYNIVMKKLEEEREKSINCLKSILEKSND